MMVGTASRGAKTRLKSGTPARAVPKPVKPRSTPAVAIATEPARTAASEKVTRDPAQARAGAARSEGARLHALDIAAEILADEVVIDEALVSLGDPGGDRRTWPPMATRSP